MIELDDDSLIMKYEDDLCIETYDTTGCNGKLTKMVSIKHIPTDSEATCRPLLVREYMIHLLRGIELSR